MSASILLQRRGLVADTGRRAAAPSQQPLVVCPIPLHHAATPGLSGAAFESVNASRSEGVVCRAAAAKKGFGSAKAPNSAKPAPPPVEPCACKSGLPYHVS